MQWRRSLKRLVQYGGPAYLVAVGYMDPGNWATDLQAGTLFHYDLLCIILISSLMAMLLQHLAIRLGLVLDMDLAAACKREWPKKRIWIPLWILAEVAMISTDVAEVVGAAVALKLLFKLPIWIGMIITAMDVLFLLGGLEKQRFRLLQWIVIALVSVIGICFLLEMIWVKPDPIGILLGILPKAEPFLKDQRALIVALGILGATCMPHNLYLHSSIVRHSLKRVVVPLESVRNDVPMTLSSGKQSDENAANQEMNHSNSHENTIIPIPDSNVDSNTNLNNPNANPIANRSMDEGHQHLLSPEPHSLSTVILYATWDAMLALTLAFFVNGSILVTAAAAFYGHPVEITTLESAAQLLDTLLGPAAGIVFGLALLAAGQSSTITGTMAGQIVFEGFLEWKIKPWIRRLVTRLLAIVPSLILIAILGDEAVDSLLVGSQVLLSIQLPFAIIPMLLIVGNKERMGIYVTPKGWLIVSWFVAIIIAVLNTWLVVQSIMDMVNV